MLFRERAIIRLDVINSTNNYAANLIKLSGAPEGTVITAQYQTSGRGQREAVWESNEGENLLCSVIYYPYFLTPENQFYLSICAALALQQTLETQLGIDVLIKWPNDIIVKDKKIAGILLEANWTENRMSSAIVGIGLNLNQLSFNIPTAISARQITNRFWNVEECLQSLLDNLDRCYIKLQKGLYADLSKEYHAKLYRLGLFTNYSYNGNLVLAEITGIDQFGRLRLNLQSGEQIICSHHEISMILPH